MISLGNGMPRTTVNFCAWVHSVPDDLKKPLPPESLYLEETSDLYQFVIDSRLLWKIWMIDEYQQYWIEIQRMGPTGKPEFHTLRIDKFTFNRIDCDPYEIEDERASR